MLLQAKQIHKMTSISLNTVKVVILSKIICHFVSWSSCSNSHFFTAWDKSRVKWDNLWTQHRKRCNLLQLAVESRNLSQAEKKITVKCKAEQRHRMTTFFHPGQFWVLFFFICLAFSYSYSLLSLISAWDTNLQANWNKLEHKKTTLTPWF